MKRNILLAVTICLSSVLTAQKAPKKSFETDYHPVEGAQWQIGEQIGLPDARHPEGVVYTATDAGAGTFFMGRGACRSDEGRWHAVYPVSALRVWEAGTLHFTIPHEQVANKGVVPMYSSTETNSLEFRPLTAYLMFDIPCGLPAIKEIRVSANKYISGSYKANLDARKVSVQLDTGTRFRSIVLKPEDGVAFTPGEYRMAVFARHLPDGIVVEIEAADGKVAVKEIASELRLALGKTRDLGVLHGLRFFDRNSESKVGTVYGDEGVYFWTNPVDPSKGKVVAAAAGVMRWAGTNELYGIHGAKEDYGYVHTKVSSLPLYKSDPENFPAVNSCEQMRKTYGGNWHVPSATEMKYLFNAYYGRTAALPENGTEYTDEESRAAAARFDAQLEAAGGEKMLALSDKYWICGQNSNGNMQYVNMRRFHNGNDVQTAEKYVRCVRDVDNHETYQKGEYPKTETGKLLESDLCPKIAGVVRDTAYSVTEGLDYSRMTVVTDAQDKMDIYLLRADLSKGLDFKVTISDETAGSKWKRQELSEMIARTDTPSNPVYAMFNADFCENREPIRPRGPAHCDGKVLVSTYSIDPRFGQQALSYIGVTFDGKVTIGPASGYEAAKKSLKECTGGGVILLQDSEIQGGYVTSNGRDPRTAIGYTPDNVIWILVVDGRHNGTEGMTYMEMASIFQALGCEAAVNLDGGGSSQLFVKNPQTGKTGLVNWPSDPHAGFGGRERPRLNAWTIVKR